MNVKIQMLIRKPHALQVQQEKLEDFGVLLLLIILEDLISKFMAIIMQMTIMILAIMSDNMEQEVEHILYGVKIALPYHEYDSLFVMFKPLSISIYY